MGNLWSIDKNGEPWLGDAVDNPYVALANPRRQRKRARKGVYPAALRRYWATHKRSRSSGRARRNPPRRSTAVAEAPQRHVTWIRARRNPGSIARRASGYVSKFPDIKTIGGITLGFVMPNILLAQARNYLPASIMGSTAALWIVKGASAVVPGLLLRKFGQAKLGLHMIIGGAVSFAVDLLKTYFPTYLSGMGSQPGLGYYTTGQVPQLAANGAVRRISRGMGMYTPNAYPVQQPMSPAIASVPERMNPGSRF